jgi:hypothetical protein
MYSITTGATNAHDERNGMARNTRNNKVALVVPTTKVCRATGIVGRINQDDPKDNDFYRDKSQKDGFSPWSKAAERAYNQAYRAGLRAANAPKVRVIEDDNDLATYNAAHADAGTRVTRGTFDTTPPKRGKRAKRIAADA